MRGRGGFTESVFTGTNLLGVGAAMVDYWCRRWLLQSVYVAMSCRLTRVNEGLFQPRGLPMPGPRVLLLRREVVVVVGSLLVRHHRYCRLQALHLWWVTRPPRQAGLASWAGSLRNRLAVPSGFHHGRQWRRAAPGEVLSSQRLQADCCVCHL